MSAPARTAVSGGVRQRAVREPDVSVVVAVHNTMPYLRECLRSLDEQTLEPWRWEVVVVDDGSTDGSTAEIEAWARARPELFCTERLPANSGGPAVPSNRGLARARGRYVFFLGADDRLVPEALARMVAAADAHRCDVLLCKMAAVGERTVPTGVFARSAAQIRLVGDGLPWALSNTKLFRRALLERHRIRYEEGMPAFSDQPFVLQACLRARRISVLADRVYYYAVRRADSGNITYRTGPEERLASLRRLLAVSEPLLGDEELRRGFHRRHFHVELYQLFRDGFRTLDVAAQLRVCRGAGELVERYGEGVLERLDASRRLVLELAADGQLAALHGVLRRQAAQLAGEEPLAEVPPWLGSTAQGAFGARWLWPLGWLRSRVPVRVRRRCGPAVRLAQGVVRKVRVVVNSTSRQGD